MYTTGELAARLSVSRDTIRNYARDFGEFLSKEATGLEPNARRRYSEHDALVLATAADLRSRGLTVEQVRESLRSGRLVDVLPDVPSPAETEARQNIALIARAEFDRALDRVAQLESELDGLRSERDRAIERWQADTSELNSHIQRLEGELGQARGELMALKAERQPSAYWVRLLVLAIIGMLIVLAVAVVFLSGRAG